MEMGLEARRLLRPAQLDLSVRRLCLCRRRRSPIPGETKVRRFYALDDCGTRINPMIIEGPDPRRPDGRLRRRHGPGDALRRERQLLGATLMDYFLPTAVETPHWETDFTVTPRRIIRSAPRAWRSRRMSAAFRASAMRSSTLSASSARPTWTCRTIIGAPGRPRKSSACMAELITINIRHARPCAGHPRFRHFEGSNVVDGRDKPGHDGAEICVAQ